MRKKILTIVLCVLPYTIVCNAQDIPQIDRTRKTQTNTLSVSTSELSFPASGGSQTVTVTASGTWNIGTETYDWGHLTTNGNTVTVKIDANNSSSARTDYFTINSGDKTVRINISQEKADILRVSSKQLSFLASGGSQTVTVTASGTWKIGTETYDWGHLTKNGNTVIVKIDANNSSSSRKDYFTINSGDKTVRVNISQEKSTLSVSTSELSFPASGGSQTVTVTASGTWKIGTETYDWGHLITNGNTVTVKIDANNSSSARTDYFTINSGDLVKIINISQSGIANIISNSIAIEKAKSLNKSSTSSAFNEALEYAKDVSTCSEVLKYINKCKKQQEKEQHRQRAKKNGGYVQFGLEPFDFASNCVSLNRELNVMYYNVGVSVRFGNFRSPVQFELGVKPGMTFSYTTYDYGKYWHYGYEYYNFHVGFHMPVYAKLKVNFCDVAYESKFYVAGMGYYNAVRDKELENQFSLGSGAGFAWRHWDLMFYYKQDLNNKHHLDDKYIGSSVVYYF